MGKFRDLTGMRFGRLIAKEIAGKKGDSYLYRCLCDCGGEKVVVSGSLRRKNFTQSCGCLAKETTVKRLTTHGLSCHTNRHPAYLAWRSLKGRCKDVENKNYGGRGISYCSRWEVFKNFWGDMGDTWKEGLTIDRIDCNGNYCKENCRWTTQLEQGRNKRNNHIIEYKGKRATISTFAAEYSLPKGRIRTRLSYGWSVEDAIEIPPSKSLKYWERVSLDDLDL